jgi:hypothetical protein
MLALRPYSNPPKDRFRRGIRPIPSLLFTVPPEASQRTGGKCTRGHALCRGSNVLPGNRKRLGETRTIERGRSNEDDLARTIYDETRLPPSGTGVAFALIGGPAALSREGVHTLRVVLEIHKTVAVVQLHLKDPQHFKPQQTGNLGPGVAAQAGKVQREDA